MNTLINSIASWLTNSHSLEMPGWMWILSIPIAILALVTILYGLLHLVFAIGFRPPW